MTHAKLSIFLFYSFHANVFPKNTMNQKGELLLWLNRLKTINTKPFVFLDSPEIRYSYSKKDP